LKSRLVQTVSHELRTPLATILSSVDLVQHYGDRISTDETQQQFQQMRTAISRLTELLNDVITFNQTDVGQFPFNPQPMDLMGFCQDLVANLNRSKPISDRLRLQGHYEDGVSPQRQIALDAKLLRYIFDNLLGNALKYSPEELPVDWTVTIRDQVVILDVRDRGIGIPEADQKLLFDPFFRATNVGNIKGTGLGLSIVKQLVELHGGDIHVSSTLGEGTTVQVRFPVVKCPARVEIGYPS
jgi:signal transduction histidine kinase